MALTVGVHVDRIHDFDVREFFHDPQDGSKHVSHRISEVFPAMGK